MSEEPSTSAVTTTTESKTTGPEVTPPPPQIVADDGVRKALALAVIAQFLIFVGYLVYVGKPVDNIQMILGAEIGFVTTVLNYFFGSSSGSTAKSALLEKK